MKERHSTYHVQHASIGIEAEVNRLKTQAQMGWEKEFRNLQWYGLQDGMKVLEVACGPGFMTEKLVENLPNSQITAIDIDQGLLDRAKGRLEHVPAKRVQFVQASAYQMDLPENEFDFAIARLLFLHLHDPLQAAQEIMRVLKPGGKLVIIDIDDGIFGAIEPEMEILPLILKKIAESQAANGGNRHIGRSLPRLLASAGYQHIDMDAVIQHSDFQGIDGFKQQFDSERFAGFHQRGTISSIEFEQLKRSYETFSTDESACAMMVFLMACGTKPKSKVLTEG
ncbi:class I SAM-dependent methyltransferase [Paenibacillus guangzhouensis]|uniref:class I SAM-dependent methyltransferase n=1 Tax=Paenibacillus guangzhouensis TaxID=1473112 RepID=UPI001267207D|nr:methyltransferase domain-containing protein [Paenibacillus guangzhouensis]